MENLRCVLRCDVGKNSYKRWLYLMLIVYIRLVTSDLIKWYIATQTEIKKVRNNIYIIGINFCKISHPRFRKVTLKFVKKKGDSFVQRDKINFFVNVEQVI